MSAHVTSRWYRAPEVILSENEYGLASDIWSLGCCLGEMVNTTDTYQEGDEITPDTRYLFNGTSCFPLSPCEEMKKQLDGQVNIISKGDQLIKILKILGHQDDVNTSFITD